MNLPLVIELPSHWTVPHALNRLQHLEDPILFESSRSSEKHGRYSFLAAEPVKSFVIDDPALGTDPFQPIRELMQLQIPGIPELPPFQGGAAGLLSYELGSCWERLPPAKYDEFRIPAAVINIYGWVLAWDHRTGRGWFICQTHPEIWSRHTASPQEIWPRLQELLSTQPTHPASVPTVPLQLQAPQFPQPELLRGLSSNFSRETYLQAVERVIEYIFAGDIFQANLSQRLTIPVCSTAAELYESLRIHNPAPFSGYFAHNDWVLMSSSPERFVQLSGAGVSTRPIKGTRQRQTTPEADLFSRDELRESVKDQAENVMIVDLLRNDLSRVCEPGSIRVPELCSVETYQTVTHLVSEVRGKLKHNATFWDLLAATFPGGSITGAPKIRAMEIITELEQVARGPYCGSLFYHGFNGTADSNILIRTITQRHGYWQLQVGGGIVAQSDPEQEYQETLHKAQGMLSAIHAIAAKDSTNHN